MNSSNEMTLISFFENGLAVGKTVKQQKSSRAYLMNEEISENLFIEITNTRLQT